MAGWEAVLRSHDAWPRLEGEVRLRKQRVKIEVLRTEGRNQHKSLISTTV